VEQGIAAAAQGTGSLTGPSERQILANQIDGILQQMVSLSRTQVGGRYIFSGDLSGQPSYAYDPNSPGAVTRLLQPVDTLLVQDATGVAFQASRTAQEIFDPRNADDTPAEGNVFAALRQLYTALRNNDSDAIVDASTALKAAQNGLNQHASFYGTVQNRVRSSVDIAETYQIQQQETLGNLRDTDLAAAALESLQVQTSISAAMASEARRQVGSLFDYLK
jgi:flagellar hook-associated protein 3 FlgL